MAFKDDLAALKRDLKEARIPVDDVLNVAGVNRSTWTRWHNQQTPRMDVWERVVGAAGKLLLERRLATVSSQGRAA
jgi:hypothetical protein